MQSISTPMSSVLEDGAWFARAHEVRLWLVRCDENLRGSLLRLIPRLEFHADNRSSWTVLPDDHTSKDDGWTHRAVRLVDDWQVRSAAFNKAGSEQGEAGFELAQTDLPAFHSAAAAVLAAQRAPLAGAVVVLAPGLVERPKALHAALAMLIKNPALAAMRWVVVVDVDVPVPAALIDELGPERALVSVGVVDRQQQRRDLQAMLSPEAPRFGAAFPLGVKPPRRVDDPPPLPTAQRDAALRASGVDPAYLEHAPELRRAVLGAALAMSEGDGESALAQQRRACELCDRLGLVAVKVVTRITLASYLSGLGRRDEARHELHAAIAAARAQQAHRAEAQAHLALGLLHNLERASRPAIDAYTAAARASEAAAEPMLAIEAWRMAGQVAARARLVDEAESWFREALRVAGGADPQVVASTSAAEAARQLAELYAKNGQAAQAAAMHEQADALERGEVHDARQ
jgi:tetratricopeptide (TPR) repeat protein